MSGNIMPCDCIRGVSLYLLQISVQVDRSMWGVLVLCV